MLSGVNANCHRFLKTLSECMYVKHYKFSDRFIIIAVIHKIPKINWALGVYWKLIEANCYHAWKNSVFFDRFIVFHAQFESLADV